MLGAALALAACGGSGGANGITAPPPQAQAAVAIVSASAVTGAGTLVDAVSVSVANAGGSGSYYLEFWGEPIRTSPSGCYIQPGQTSCPHPVQQKIGTSQVVSVTAGYAESLSYSVPGTVSSVKVFTQPVNTAVYAETGCAKARDYGACP